VWTLVLLVGGLWGQREMWMFPFDHGETFFFWFLPVIIKTIANGANKKQAIQNHF
jgi:hypothetical protein